MALSICGHKAHTAFFRASYLAFWITIYVNHEFLKHWTIGPVLFHWNKTKEECRVWLRNQVHGVKSVVFFFGILSGGELLRCFWFRMGGVHRHRISYGFFFSMWRIFITAHQPPVNPRKVFSLHTVILVSKWEIISYLVTEWTEI